MAHHTLVSIITPTYNHDKFIGKCIESVLSQTYPNWEQIIIDDGSTDKTAEIVAKYKDDRITFLRQNNKGIFRLSETYNKALKIARGELIAVLEGDDFWPSWKLERQIRVFDKQEIVLSAGKVAVTNIGGKTIYCCPNDDKLFRSMEKEKILRKLLFQNFIPACSVVCRKDALIAIGGFKQPQNVPSVDYATWLELSLIGRFELINEVLGFYRLHKNQASFIWSKELSLGNMRYGLVFFEKLPDRTRKKLGVNISDLIKAYQYNIAAINFYWGRMNLYDRKWKESRDNFKRALLNSKLLTKAEASLGIICSYLQVDLEWTAALLHKPQLSEFR